ncbi:substrate-binding domain-containing protein [Neiella marina]|uniref:Substrate-binding domain-containing protein n=1 Tax=Neiella holothuriorum TaxID=2870530 RepID=A0ABS7ECV8_9GAMM|nr:substrate-binding domain-containing protein [Neiella holothuriorum]MBW8190150.1 substrate-binding domain-containing protein [Neiella holothuriorum]
MTFSSRSVALILAMFWSTLSQANECISLITAGGGSKFWQEVVAGAQKAASELDITLHASRDTSETNVASQRQLVDEAIAKGCFAVVMAPNSIDRAHDVARLQQHNIISVFIDRDLSSDQTSGRVSAILTDNYATGERAAIAMAQELPKASQVALLRMDKAVVSTTDREQGFIDGAAQMGLNLVLDQYIGSSAEATKTKVYELLRKHPQIAGVFTPNESTTTATVVARQHLASPSAILHIGVDANKVLVDALRSEQLHSLFLQRPFLMGYRGVMSASDAHKGFDVPDITLTESTYITVNDIDLPEIQALLKESQAQAPSGQ